MMSSNVGNNGICSNNQDLHKTMLEKSNYLFEKWSKTINGNVYIGCSFKFIIHIIINAKLLKPILVWNANSLFSAFTGSKSIYQKTQCYFL
jgi:hypothetical protein